jgi:type IV pilus assembly protein PilC
MPTFICKLGSPDGKVLTREFEATDAAVLKRDLEDQGYFVFNVSKRPLKFFLSSGIIGGGVKKRDLLLLNQEMLVLIKAGLPIVQVIDTLLEEYESGVLSNALRQVKEDVKGGDSLSGAMERHKHVFPKLYTASIRAGERTGDLPVTILRYIRYLRKMEDVRKKVISALFYPSILVVVSILAVCLLLFYVIPILSKIFTDSGAELPLITRMLIAFASFVRGYFLAGLLPCIGLFVAFRFWASSENGRYLVDRFKLRVPYMGAILTDYSLAAFARTLANLLGGGIPLVEALHMATGTLNNAFMERSLGEAVKYIEEGGRISAAFARTGIMPPLAVRMLLVGETTGALEEMLVNIAEYLEESLEERLHILTATFEPAIMIIMGLLIGVIIVAMYLPIFKIAGTVG